MISEFGVRTVDNGYIVWWVEKDQQGQEFRDEKVFLIRSEMEQFVALDMINQMRI